MNISIVVDREKCDLVHLYVGSYDFYAAMPLWSFFPKREMFGVGGGGMKKLKKELIFYPLLYGYSDC